MTECDSGVFASELLSSNKCTHSTVCSGADQLGASSREGSPGVRGRQVSGSRQAKATTQGLCTCDMSCENSPIFQDKEGELSVGRLQPRLGQHREGGEGM